MIEVGKMEDSSKIVDSGHEVVVSVLAPTWDHQSMGPSRGPITPCLGPSFLVERFSYRWLKWRWKDALIETVYMQIICKYKQVTRIDRIAVLIIIPISIYYRNYLHLYSICKFKWLTKDESQSCWDWDPSVNPVLQFFRWPWWQVLHELEGGQRGQLTLSSLGLLGALLNWPALQLI